MSRRPLLSLACISVLVACQSLIGIEDTTEVSGTGGTATGGTAGAGGGTSGSGGAGGGGGSPGDGGDCDASAGFTISGPSATLSIVRGVTAEVTVKVTRAACFTGAVDLGLTGLPNGVTAAPASVPSGQDQAAVQLTATQTAALGLAAPTIEGTAGSAKQTAKLALLVKDPPGIPDQSFDKDGTLLIPAGANESVRALGVLSTGEVIAAIHTNTDFGWKVIKLKVDGSVDAGFSVTGLPTSGRVADLAITPADEILLAGNDANTVVVVKLHADGSKDSTFGKSGTFAPPNYTFTAAPTEYGIALQPDGKILLTGHVQTASDGFLVRVTKDGALDGAFNGYGHMVLDSNTAFRAVGYQKATKRAVAGATRAKSDPDFFVAAANDSGKKDTTFGTSGETFLDKDFESLRDLVVTADDKIVVAGYSGTGQIGVAPGGLGRLGADGKPDLTFGTNGVASIPIPPGSKWWFIQSIVEQPDGKIIAAGYSDETYDSWAPVGRVNTDGKLDTGFNAGGSGDSAPGLKVFGGGQSNGGDKAWFYAVALAPDGRIVAGGRQGNNLFLVRLWQ
ncbi:MAG: hypothetical protein L6Q84_32225 [Polyangiaceae bacterium]|nr:hypothetical protein [Polyangiaceae bacterium]